MADTTEPQNTEKDSSTAPPPSPAEKRIVELEDQVKDLKEKEGRYLYLYAEFENFKKRAAKERADLLKFGWESLAQELLTVLDHLESGLAHAPAGMDKNFLQGFQLVHQHLKTILEKQGVQPIETLNRPFDPNFHEALGHQPSSEPAGTILQEQRKGYTLHGRLLRPARVSISQGQAPSN